MRWSLNFNVMGSRCNAVINQFVAIGLKYIDYHTTETVQISQQLLFLLDTE